VKFADWLNNRLNDLEWDQADLVRASGLSSTSVSRYVNGEGIPSRFSVLERIASALRVPVEEIQDAVRGVEHKAPRSPEDILAELEANQPVAVPVIHDLVAHMGAGGGFIDDYVYLSPSYRRRRKHNIIAIHARGDCMGPQIADGDFVLIDKDAQAQPNDLVAAAVDGHAIIRRLTEVAGRLVLRADASGETHTLTPEDQIVGKIIQIQRSFAPL
jgi:SOS-response transcriptional repressor LexA